MDMSDWDARVAAWYEAGFDESRPEESVAGMRDLLAGHPEAGPLATFELAGVYDSLGLETDAVPLYKQALAEGLDDTHATRARIQLASTLRNLGETDEALALLSVPSDSGYDAARRAFLALALHSAGRHDEALRQVLEALIPTLPRYHRSLTGYAAELTETEN
ncbi:tetratricopeptide repeat protein [Demequina lutea]|uniref:Putative negative regulator of RcsB-dependent stress response n=1 Tax=Demequina lutea TaxID=431489 RepID=A0A7Z0CIX2_9MICO|nr:tetratricopeptide repeat protein [Demequina lutea]NYI40172.1 putative negative regulator of RcsB-dependent stress response [Demequina lutea]